MSDVVRKASFGVGQYGLRAYSPGQVEDCRALNAENVIPWQLEIPKRQQWIKEWSSDSFGRNTAEHDLYGMSLIVRWATQRKSGEVSDSLESEQTEGRLIRVDRSSDSSNVEVPEGAQEQSRHMAPKEIEWRGLAGR